MSSSRSSPGRSFCGADCPRKRSSLNLISSILIPCRGKEKESTPYSPAGSRPRDGSVRCWMRGLSCAAAFLS